MRTAFLAILVLIPLPAAAVSVPLQLTGVRPGPISVTRGEDSVTVTWLDETSRVWRATFSLDPAQPLVTSIGTDGDPLIRAARPFYQGEVGKRRGGWYAFFDDPTTHPDGTRHVQGTFQLRAATARSVSERVEIVFDGLRMGSFDGGLAYTFCPGSRLIHQEAVLTTYDPDVAYYYDAGLELAAPSDRQAEAWPWSRRHTSTFSRATSPRISVTSGIGRGAAACRSASGNSVTRTGSTTHG
jgi:hypothetical protein